MTSSITNLGKFPKSIITPYIFMVTITKGCTRVQKVMKIKYFDYFFDVPTKLDGDYIWTKCREIWVNLVKFSRVSKLVQYFVIVTKIWIIIKFDVCCRWQDTVLLPFVAIVQAKGMNTSQFRKCTQIWSNMTSLWPFFLIIIKFGVCHRCQDTRLPLVVNFKAKGEFFPMRFILFVQII